MSALNKNLLTLSTLLFVFISAGQVEAAINDMDLPVLHPAIPLLDEAGNHVLDSGNPYSSRTTCGTGGCHDYESITHAFHIEQGRDEARDDFGALRGLTNLVSPGYFGGYNCMGGSNPDQLAKKSNATAADFGDLGAADHIMRCDGCHAGGGWMEKDRNGNRYDEVDITTVDMLDGDYYSRNTNAGTDAIDSHDHTDHDMGGIAAWDWKKSGVVENDCLMCHVQLDALQIFDPQLNVEGASSALTHFKTLRGTYLADAAQFRSMNTSILEFLNLKHADGVQEDISVVTFDRTTEIPEDVMIHTSTVPAYILNKNYAGQPLLNWNAAAFDEDRKVAIPMVRFPANDTCMMCHRTSNSRRGFYGFGEDAATDLDDDGLVIEDYQDDVHKGKTWVEPNGEERAIENCNVCHTRNYYNPAYANVDLDADHNFLKGNSDMDVRNDLDYSPNAKSCEYCHNDAPNPAIPSGHESMQAAHLELWKFSGDLGGYPLDTLERITQTHLDVVSCQACHITDKTARGSELLPMYRYRAAENGDLTIVPYNPKMRYYWKDNNSGISLTKTERDSVFEMRTDADGNNYGVILDPETGEVLGTVSAYYSHGSWRFGDPEDYDTFVGLKNAFDKIFLAKGIDDSDAVMVWTESNQYLMSHNTRPAVSSVQCVQCHNVKQDGSFSALLSPTGLFGEANSKEITQLIDPRLVDEGLVIFDYPYMKADANGLVTENVSDILYASKINPSMSILSAAIVDVDSGVFKRMSAAEAITAADITDSTLAATLFPGGDVFNYKTRYGSSAIRAVSLMIEDNGQTELIVPTYRVQVALSNLDVVATIADADLGGLVSDAYSLQITDSNSNQVTNFATNRVLIKIPYAGSNTNLDEVKVIFSTDGTSWTEMNADNIVLLQPHSDVAGSESVGMITFWSDHLSDYAVVDNTIASVSGTQDSSTSDGGGSVDYVLLVMGLLVMALSGRGRRRIKD